jgi:CrcB protein
MRTALLQALLVGIGGFLGSLLRHEVNVAAAWLLPQVRFPIATGIVNLVGCLLIGVVGALASRGAGLSAELRLFAAVGVLGGLTTFSTFGNETFLLLRSGSPAVAVANVVLEVGLGLLGVWLGYALVESRPLS